MSGAAIPSEQTVDLTPPDSTVTYAPEPPATPAREALQRVLAKLDIPRDYAAVLGVWPHGDDRLEVHLSPVTFWRAVQRTGLAVTSTEQPERLFPHRHAFTVEALKFLTFSAEPVLRPGVLTPGYALRLT